MAAISSSPSVCSREFRSSEFTYTVFSFSPKTTKDQGLFFTYFFAGKLNTLCMAIQDAALIIQNQPKNPFHRNIFIAPEYTFNEYQKKGHRQYYTQAQKKTFQNKMLELSNTIDMIIVPGTFRWYKENAQGVRTYRNKLYLFYRNTEKGLNKKSPYLEYDFDFLPVEGFTEDHHEFLRLHGTGPRSVFQKKPQESLIVELAGVTFGLEICYDTIRELLRKELSKQVKKDPEFNIDFYLLISSGINHGNERLPVQTKPYVAVHIDRGYSLEKTSGGTSITMVPPESPLTVIEHFVFGRDPNQQKFCKDIAYTGDGVERNPKLGKILPSISTIYILQKENPYYELEELINSYPIQDAMERARTLLGSDYTLNDLKSLYNIFSLKGYAFEGLHIILTMPCANQKTDILSVFYEMLIRNWVKMEIEREWKDAFLKHFCYALALNGQPRLGIEFTKYVRSTSLRANIVQVLVSKHSILS